MKAVAKGLGLGVAAVGLAGYGAVRLALWPARVALRAIGGRDQRAMVRHAGIGAAPQKPSKFVAMMLMLAAPALGDIMGRRGQFDWLHSRLFAAASYVAVHHLAPQIQA